MRFSCALSRTQTCTDTATAPRTMTSTWWCAATVARWWSPRRLRRTASGGTVLSARRAPGRLPRPPSSSLVRDPRCWIRPLPETGRRKVNVRELTPPPQPDYLSPSEGPRRLTRWHQGTYCWRVFTLRRHGNGWDEKAFSCLIDPW